MNIGDTVYIEAYPCAGYRKAVKLVSLQPPLAIIEEDASYYWQKAGSNIRRRVVRSAEIHATQA